MKRNMMLLTLMAALVLVLCAVAPVAASDITITGEVTDSYQIITANGDVYEVGETQEGEALMSYVGEVVEVKGTLTEEEGVKTISVVEFKVLNQ